MQNPNNTTELKKEILVRLIKAFYSDDFAKTADKIPFDMRPKNAEIPYRCCIYKERAILRQRVIASLGHNVESDDEMKPLYNYAQEAMQRENLEEDILTVIDTACHGCVPNRIYVTDLCQNCVAKPCINSCHFNAISSINGKSVIDGNKCKGCMKCMQACPYNAIAKIIVPCENSCPTKAIHKNEHGHAEIDFSKCIGCGACVATCPFGAVHEKSQVIDVLRKIKEGKKLVAMLAPSVVGQIPFSINKIAQALIDIGFYKVIEVARGADITAVNEAKDFKERMERGDKFMTTSCCASYKELVRNHVPELAPFVSATLTPMAYTAEIAKKEVPDCLSVFIGPCVAKRKEGQFDKNVDFVMSFEEMDDIFTALELDLSKCQDYEFDVAASKEGRNFAITGGVANSVKVASDEDEVAKISPVLINGLDVKSIRELKSWAKNGECPEGNLVEVMTCEGGCVGGSSCVSNKRTATKCIQQYAAEGKSLKDTPVKID